MIHQPTAQLIQLHRRLGDAKLMRWQWRYSIGQSLDALEDITRECAVTPTAATEKLADALSAQSAALLTWLDPEYPACLRALESDAPPLLYLLGDSGRLSARSIAIIGMRKPTAHGKAAAAIAVENAVPSGWAIVSGNAPGIDCAAHEATVNQAAGQTIVFPPSSLDQYQPKFRLPAGAESRVTVASPFVPGSEIQPWMFLRRNSLVAAHCSAALVAETGVRGGTLDTVKKLKLRHKPTFATALPADSRYAAAHAMLSAGGVPLIPLLDDPGAAMSKMLNAAAHTSRHPPVKTAVLPDFFGEDLLS